jgi:hypothetical protein
MTFHFPSFFLFINLLILVKRRALIFPDFHTTFAKLFYELDTFDSDLCDPFLGCCMYIMALCVLISYFNFLSEGKLERAAVLKALCSGFKETTDPPVCLSSGWWAYLLSRSRLVHHIWLNC